MISILGPEFFCRWSHFLDIKKAGVHRGTVHIESRDVYIRGNETKINEELKGKIGEYFKEDVSHLGDIFEMLLHA